MYQKEKAKHLFTVYIYICRYFERSNGYLRLKGTNWVLFWHGTEGYKCVQDYATIAKSIPASFE